MIHAGSFMQVLLAVMGRAHERHARRLTSLVADERGEGVISAAIAVLIMAFLGVAMWVGFSSVMESATSQISTQVQQIGG